MELLGTFLDEASISVMKSAGMDHCGEKGENHTLAVDGPVAREPFVFPLQRQTFLQFQHPQLFFLPLV